MPTSRVIPRADHYTLREGTGATTTCRGGAEGTSRAALLAQLLAAYAASKVSAPGAATRCASTIRAAYAACRAFILAASGRAQRHSGQ